MNYDAQMLWVRRNDLPGSRVRKMHLCHALEQETKRVWKEEWGRNKFRGALWGSNSELKLRRAKRDQSRVEGMILEDKLKACQRSKMSLSEQLSKIEENMWAIINQYKEKLSLAATHEQRLEDEYAKVSVLQG